MDYESILIVQLGRFRSSVYVDGRDGDTVQPTSMVDSSLVKSYGPLISFHHVDWGSQWGLNTYIFDSEGIDSDVFQERAQFSAPSAARLRNSPSASNLGTSS